MGQSLAIPRVIPNDWKRLDLIINKIKMRLGHDGSPTFTDLTLTGVLTLSKICTVAAGLNVLRVTGLQTDGVAMTGTLRGAYVDVSNGSTAATGTIRAMELKARTEAPGDTGNDVTTLEGLSISADSKGHSVTTMRAAEFILDGSTGGTITEAVGLRIANNLQANKATTSYGLQIYRDSFDYTADIDLTPSPVITANGTRIIKFDTVSLNTLIGEEAGNSITGVNNTFIGYRAGYSATDINNIVLLGYQAGYNLTSSITADEIRSVLIGFQSGYNLTTGEKNTAIGNQALLSETTGENSIAIGHSAGYSQVGSNACVLVGALSGYYNIDGAQNTYIGTHAGRGVETKSSNYNVGVGYRALYTIGTTTTGAEFNTAVGFEAGFYLTTGSDNVFVGVRAGRDTTDGTWNFALGTHALLENENGDANICIGHEAGKSTDGNSFSYNALIGYRAGYKLQGNANIIIGHQAGYDATTLHDSILIGYRAGYNLTTLDDNVMIGRDSGYTGTTADACTYLGYQTGYTATAAARRICIGHSAGFYDTNSDRFILDNQKRTNAAEEITNALMYGVMAAAPANQTLRINAALTANNYTAANLLTACATNAGALDFSAASKTLTVEDDAIVSQDYSSDASPTFAGLNLGTGELTCGSINRVTGTLTLEIGGTAEVSITTTTVTLGGNLIIPDNGTIGSASDTDVMTIDASGNCTFSVFPITPSAAPDANYEVANKKYVDDNVGGGFSSRISVWLNGDQTIPNEEWTKIAFDTEVYDGDGEFTGGRFTATTAGYYHVTGRTLFKSMTAGTAIYLLINRSGTGSSTNANYSVPAGSSRLEVSSDVYLNGSTDYIEIWCFHDEITLDRDISGAIADTNLVIHRFA